MVVDGVSITIQLQKNGTRRLCVQGAPFGINVNLSRAQINEFIRELEEAAKPDHYEILGVERTASDDKIQAAYRTLAKQHHPDVKGSHLDMTQLNAAYETLSDSTRRTQYDQTLT